MMGYEYQEFPKTLYRKENGFAVGKTFASAEDVEPGWVSIDEVGAPIEPPPEPKVEKPAAKVEEGGSLLERSLRMQESIALLEADLAAERADNEAKAKRIIALETFAAAIAEGEDVPAEVRDMARLLTGGEAPVAETTKPKVKPRAKA